MPSAFEHNPTLSVPNSVTTNNSVVIWDGANDLGEGTIILTDGAVTGVDSVTFDEISHPSYPANGKGIMYSTSDGDLWWQSNVGGSNTRIQLNASSSTFTGDVTFNSGNLVIGTAGKGVDFSVNTQSAVSGAALVTGGELLDWYEEGTWTPIVQDHSGGIMSQQTNGPNNNGGKVGKYTRIGNVVYIQCRIICNGNGTANTAQTVTIHGLPFTHQNMFNLQAHMAVGFGAAWAITAGVGPGNWIEPGNDFINMAMFDDAAGTTNMFIAGDLSHDGQIGLTGHYFV